MSDSDYNLYQNLDKKYNKEVRNVRGTFQTFNSAIESLIKASEGTVWKDVQQVRTDNHNKFMAKLNSMNAETAQKTINFYKKLYLLCEQARQETCKTSRRECCN